MRKIAAYTIIILLVITVMPVLIVMGFKGDLDNNIHSNSNNLNNDHYLIEDQEQIQQQNQQLYPQSSLKKGQNEHTTSKDPPVDDIAISVYNTQEKKLMMTTLEEYIKGVVAAEMPANFEIEALKAQAVAARTFAYGRIIGAYAGKEGVHEGIPICTDHKHCQAWISKAEVKKRGGIIYGPRNWEKIEKAVNETKGIILEHDGKVVNALYHSNSGGNTENCGDVWEGVNVPYLRSVISRGEDRSSVYKATVNIKIDDFINTLKGKYPDIKIKSSDIPSCIKVLDYTTGKRVKTLKIANIEMKGTEFRSLFDLNSANFTIEKADKDSLKITTLGYGHGVGMSQYGANYLASRGGSFDEILKYYYVGTKPVLYSSIESP